MKEKLLLKILILLPIIDLITSLSRRFFEITFSFGVVIKFIIVLFLLAFIILYKDKDKRKLIKILLFYMVYIILFVLLKIPVIFDNKILLYIEIYSLARFLFFPILFFIFFYLIKKESIDVNKFKYTMIISVCIYMFIFIFTYFTKTSFNSYIGENLGAIGWYYAANEISAILLLLFPFIYYLLEKNKIILFYVIGLISVFFISLIGTKVSSFGILIITILFLLFPLLFKVNNYKKNFKHNLLFFIVTLFILFGSPSMFNLKLSNEKFSKEYVKEQEKFEKECESENKCDNYYYRKMMLMLLSGRDIYFNRTLNKYTQELNISTLLFGTGINNAPKIETNSTIGKWIEMDFFDLFFHYGLIGTILVLSPFVFVTILAIKKKALFKSYDSTMYMFIILLLLGVSFISGHVISAPAVSTYLVIYLLLYLSSINSLDKEEVNNKKISILSLHLGYGGIEQANISLSNMLSEHYEVELVSLYKTIDEIPYKYDDKVKIKYLTNLKPNKKEFKEAIRSKNIVKTITEGFKAAKILLLKKVLIEQYVSNCDSKYIVSSRVEFNKRLGNFAKKGVIKIAQEHRHHNNDFEYINKLRKSLIDIDYLLPVSQELTDFYNNEFKSIKSLNVEYIKHCLDYYPDKPNNYNGKTIISVGRLEKEKGFLDLIDVFKELVKMDKKYKLILVGSGSQESDIKKKIQKYKLNKNVILTGYLNKEKVNKEYSKASLYVMTSTSEAFGLVLIEAMAFGIPCLSFDSAAGAKEIINNNNGVLLKGRDIIEMSNKINDIFNNRTLYDNISKEARKTSSKYKFEVVQKDWLQFIERI